MSKLNNFFLVPRKDLRNPHGKKGNFILGLVAGATIWSAIGILLLLDLTATIYQAIYFGIMKIPKIPRNKFIGVNRVKLDGLTWGQRLSCGYCEYANSLIAWVKAIVNQTEIYSCAIKYDHRFPGQEYQKDFYDPKEFEENKN